MPNFNILIFIQLFFLCLSYNVFSQGKQLKKAKIAYDQFEFHKAMDFYKRAYSKSSDRSKRLT